MLQRSGATRIAPSLEGLAGIGKTELALQLVHELAGRGDFPGGIFWFDAENPDLSTTWGSTIADRLGLPEGPAPDRAREAVQAVARRGQPVLLILDNVESWTSQARPTPLPEGTHVRTLVTTRRRNLGGPRFQHFKVDFLERDFALELLEGVSGRKLAEVEGTEDLLAHLDGHALAIELAGAYLGEIPGSTPAQYLDALTEGAPVEEVGSEVVRYNRTVTQALQVIWNRLDDDLRAAWRLAACFEPELVTVELSEAVGLDASARHRLHRLHLIDADDEGRWQMHRLTREFGNKAGTAEELADTEKAFMAGCFGIASQIREADGFRIYLPNRAHLEFALQGIERVLGENDFRCSVFKDRIATALQSLGDLTTAKRLFEQALEANLTSLGEAHPFVATQRSNLALVLHDLGDPEGAIELLEQALESDLKNFGEEHSKVANRRSNLAVVLHDLGHLKGPQKLLEKALEADLKNLGEGHPNVAIRRSNLASVLQDLGDLQGARKLIEQALKADLKNFGEEHPNVAIGRSNLAMLFEELGDLQNARKLLEQALEADLKNFGEGHPDVAIRRSNLAGVLEHLGDGEAARRMALAALQIAANQPEGSRVRVEVEGALHWALSEDG